MKTYLFEYMRGGQKHGASQMAESQDQAMSLVRRTLGKVKGLKFVGTSTGYSRG